MRKGKKLLRSHSGALLFSTEHCIQEVCITTHLGECVFGCCLVALFFRKSLAFSSRDAFNDHSGVERWACAVRIVGDVVDKIKVDAIFLLPFQEFTLEVHLLICHRVEVEHSTDDALLDKLKRIAETAVEIDGTHEGFKTVALEIRIVGATMCLALDEAVDAQFFRQFAERFAGNDFGARVGEKSFALVGILSINDMAHDRFEHGIAEELQTFVVERLIAGLLRTVFVRFMGKGCAVQIDVVRTETHDLIEGGAKLFVFAKKESGSVENIFHTELKLGDTK